LLDNLRAPHSTSLFLDRQHLHLAFGDDDLLIQRAFLFDDQ
jgi:hypothetical protein